MKSIVASKLRQIPQGYLVIGVDPHKKTHAAVLITQDFTTHAKFKVLTLSSILARSWPVSSVRSIQWQIYRRSLEKNTTSEIGK